ncbi:MAG: T9SS type A sorting domain-containing protein [Cryomorphaceae bacterium]|nr:T9SS type A sorting domain-containing protein [Cryomorphaceae bacterium]
MHNLRANSSISVIDLSGRVLIQKSTLAAEEILNVSRLTPGMYILSVGNRSIPWMKY